MFGIGLPELGVIFFVAVLVFGPDRLPDFARQAGRFLYQAKKVATSARDDLRSELGPDYADLRLQDLDPRNVVRKHIVEAMNDAEAEEQAERNRARDLEQQAAGGLPTPFDDEAT